MKDKTARTGRGLRRFMKSRAFRWGDTFVSPEAARRATAERGPFRFSWDAVIQASAREKHAACLPTSENGEEPRLEDGPDVIEVPDRRIVPFDLDLRNKIHS
jgi:hypothetical protein